MAIIYRFQLMIKHIYSEDSLLAMIIQSDYRKEGINFFTPDEFSQQLAYMEYKRGKKIQPHVHNSVAREIYFTQEVLFIRKGELRVDFYSENKKYIESYVLRTGDVILLIQGGHGFEVLKDLEMIEVKQGPYVGEQDKTRFTSVNSSDIKINHHE